MCANNNSITHFASQHAVTPLMSDAIIVCAHVELCHIKYSNLQYERKNSKITEKIVEKNCLNKLNQFCRGFSYHLE